MRKNVLIVIIPVLFGTILASIFSKCFKQNTCEICRLEFVLNAIITCAVTFSGFILTSVSILIGLSSSPLMRLIRSNGGLTELRCRYTESLIIGLILIIFCIVLGGKTDTSNNIPLNWMTVGVGLLSSYLFSMLTTAYFLLQIIGKLPQQATVVSNNTPSVPSGSFR